MRPTKIRVFGSDFSVGWPDTIPGAVGLCEADKERISVCTKQAPVAELDTLLHEVIHAIEYKMGMDHNEDWTRRIATGLVGVFRDNPDFMKYMNAIVKGK